MHKRASDARDESVMRLTLTVNQLTLTVFKVANFTYLYMVPSHCCQSVQNLPVACFAALQLAVCPPGGADGAVRQFAQPVRARAAPGRQRASLLGDPLSCHVKPAEDWSVPEPSSIT